LVILVKILVFYFYRQDPAFLYFGITAFGGNSFTANCRAPPQELRTQEEIDSVELRGIAARQTIILDCCRRIFPDIILKERAAKFAKSFLDLNEKDCRRYYEDSINKCAPGIIVTL